MARLRSTESRGRRAWTAGYGTGRRGILSSGLLESGGVPADGRMTTLGRRARRRRRRRCGMERKREGGPPTLAVRCVASRRGSRRLQSPPARLPGGPVGTAGQLQELGGDRVAAVPVAQFGWQGRYPPGGQMPSVQLQLGREPDPGAAGASPTLRVNADLRDARPEEPIGQLRAGKCGRRVTAHDDHRRWRSGTAVAVDSAPPPRQEMVVRLEHQSGSSPCGP